MTADTAETSEPAVTLLAPAPAAPVVRRARRRRSPLHVLGAVVLLAATLLALAGAATVVVQRLGFAPVLSPSMVPAYDPGDLLVTRPTAARDMRVGEVYVLPLPDSGGQRYVHRVTSVKTDASGRPVVTTKGDANEAADPWQLTITSEKVPHVIAAAPRLGSLALHTNGAALRIPLILLITGAVLLALKRALLDR